MQPAPLTFAAYMASRKPNYDTWGDFVRLTVKSDGFAQVREWEDLVRVIERERNLDLRLKDARASWKNYQSIVRKQAGTLPAES